MKFQGIKAITFDVGGTLIDPWPSVGEIYSIVAAELKLGNVSAHTLNDQFAAAWKQKKNFDYSRAAWFELVKASFVGLLRVSPEFFEALYARFEQPDVWRVYDDAKPTLEKLRDGGFRLGVISNWDHRLGPLLGRLGLQIYFDPVVLSVDAGATKPSAVIFQRAASTMELPPKSILHIGDDFTEDFHGARDAGFHALLLDRYQRNRQAESIVNLDGVLKFLI